MADKKITILLILALFWAGVPAIAAAAGAVPPAAEKQEKQEWQAAVVIERSIYSHTSFEFGNPFEPHQAPLSRLEFPLNTWWGGVELRREFSRWSLGTRLLTNLTQNTDGDMKDWDWDDEAAPDQLSIYSVSRCRIDPSYQARFDIDLKVSDWLGLPPSVDIRTALGFQWQRFNFMAHDGTQWQYRPPAAPDPLPGDSLHFRQDYQLYLVGIKTKYEWGRSVGAPPSHIFFDCYWGYVKGENEDHHLLRPGFRLTLEKSTGEAWLVSGGARAYIRNNISAVLEMSYLTIRTTGTHRLYNEPFGMDFRFDYGVRVWSQQATVAARLECLF